jgi:anthranilate 1,2-dioxygenase small subunit
MSADRQRDLHRAIEDFLFDYADCLDSRRYQEWPNFFDPDDCVYEVCSRENFDLGLPAPLMSCYSHGMLVDRVTMLVNETLTYRPMYLRHQTTNLRVREKDASTVTARANFTVHQCDVEGVASLYLVGRYEDEIHINSNGPKLRRKRAILDSFGIDTMLAVPV